MMNFSMSFDPTSLSHIAQMYGMNILLSPPVQAAMSQGGDLLVTAAVANTWATFKNPSGVLAGSIQKIVQSPYEIQIGSNIIYAHRREFSFKGPDSLGRMFPNDPAAFYFTDAIQQESQAVLQLVDAGVAVTLGGL